MRWRRLGSLFPTPPSRRRFPTVSGPSTSGCSTPTGRIGSTSTRRSRRRGRDRVRDGRRDRRSAPRRAVPHRRHQGDGGGRRRWCAHADGGSVAPGSQCRRRRDRAHARPPERRVARRLRGDHRPAEARADTVHRRHREHQGNHDLAVGRGGGARRTRRGGNGGGAGARRVGGVRHRRSGPTAAPGAARDLRPHLRRRPDVGRDRSHCAAADRADRRR